MVLESAAINVGARLIIIDDGQRVTKMEDAAVLVSRHRELGLSVGQTASLPIRTALARALAESLLEVASGRPASVLTSELLITAPLEFRGSIDAVLFSGGVSEYLYETETQSYGDLGILLGQQIRELTSVYLPDIPVESSLQRIRATVIGASQFTAQVSGNTIYIAHPALLPLRNLQVVTVRFDDAALSVEGIRASIGDALERAEIVDGEGLVAFGMVAGHSLAVRTGLPDSERAVRG